MTVFNNWRPREAAPDVALVAATLCSASYDQDLDTMDYLSRVLNGTRHVGEDSSGFSGGWDTPTGPAVSSFQRFLSVGGCPKSILWRCAPNYLVLSFAGITGLGQAYDYSVSRGSVASGTGAPGLVSRYALTCFLAARDALVAALSVGGSPSNPNKILLTGHSFGGLMAVLLADYLQHSVPACQVQVVYTFGAPPVLTDNYCRSITAPIYGVYAPGDAVVSLIPPGGRTISVITNASDGSRLAQSQTVEWGIPGVPHRLTSEALERSSQLRAFRECGGNSLLQAALSGIVASDEHLIGNYCNLLVRLCRRGVRSSREGLEFIGRMVNNMEEIVDPVANAAPATPVAPGTLPTLPQNPTPGSGLMMAPNPTWPGGAVTNTETNGLSVTQVRANVRVVPSWQIVDRDRDPFRAMAGDGHAKDNLGDLRERIDYLRKHDAGVRSGNHKGSVFIGDDGPGGAAIQEAFDTVYEWCEQHSMVEHFTRE